MHLHPMEITPPSRLNDILAAYPQLEEIVIKAALPFKNLRNPVLRRTLGRLATVETAAQIGGLDILDFVNQLRRAVGQQDLVLSGSPESAVESKENAADPEWTCGEPQYVVDGNALLANGVMPLVEVNQLLAQLLPGRFILLVTDFEPAPIIEAVRKQNRQVYHKADPEEPGKHRTYFK